MTVINVKQVQNIFTLEGNPYKKYKKDLENMKDKLDSSFYDQMYFLEYEKMKSNMIWETYYENFVLIPSLLCYGDYYGTILEQSNHKEFLENFGDLPYIWEDCICGINSIVIESKAIENEEIIEMLNSLCDYPLLNEEIYYNICEEKYIESWKEFAEEDFKKLIINYLNLDDEFDFFLNEIESEHLLNFYESLIPSGEYYIEETGGIFIPIDECKNQLTKRKLVQFIKELKENKII